MFPVLVRVPNNTGGTKIFSIECDDNCIVWQLKISVFALIGVQPVKQGLFLPNETKELDNNFLLKNLAAKVPNEKVLVIMKTREERARSRKVKKVQRCKKFRELVCPAYSFAGGRGIIRGVVGTNCEMILQAIGKDFQPLVSKDGRMFDIILQKRETTTREIPQITFVVCEESSTVKATWIPDEGGNYFATIRVLTNDGPQNIGGSPFQILVLDPKNSGHNVRKMAYDKDWSVEAAQILGDWAGKEEYHKLIVDEVGMACLLDMLTMEPQAQIQPLMGLVFSRLIQKDVTKKLIIHQGGLSALIALVTLNSRIPSINHFVSRSIATIGRFVTKFYGTSVQEEQKQMFSLCNSQLFTMLNSMLNDSDQETTRNLARALAYFSSNKYYLSLIAEAAIYPQLVGMFENTGNDISIRRQSLSAIANFTCGDTAFRKRFFTDARVLSIVKTLSHQFTEDLLVTEAVRALANLSETESYAELLMSTHLSVVDHIIDLISETDSLTTWEVTTCLQMLPEKEHFQFENELVDSFVRDDIFNYESTRLLSNLLVGAKSETGVLCKLIIKHNSIRNIVQFIKSRNLQLQYIACKCIAELSTFEDCRKEIISISGLDALCSALNFCTSTATEYIVAALAQMPLDVKGALVNIIGDSGIEKLINLLKQSDNKLLQKDTAILLASLAGSEDNGKIVSQGGSAFLKNLIELARSGKVNVQTNINPAEITYDKIVGQGISGVVWKATWRNQFVAVKKFDEDSIAFSDEEFKSEVALMSILRHENIVHCIGSSVEPGSLFIVSELFDRGSLAAINEDTSIIPTTPLIVHLALGAARGMKYLHALGIIHRDLKAGNLLVSDNWTAKVADFGLSRMMDKTMTRGVGTPIYTSPEALKGNDYTQKADVYSFAYILWELVVRDIPFKDLVPFEAVRRACDENLRPPIPENCIFEGLITNCWHNDPDKRPDFTEIVQILTEIQALVGAFRGEGSEEEDLEEQQYNYAEANEILHRTLRTLKPTDTDSPPPAATRKRKGSGILVDGVKDKSRPSRPKRKASREGSKVKSKSKKNLVEGHLHISDSEHVSHHHHHHHSHHHSSDATTTASTVRDSTLEQPSHHMRATADNSVLFTRPASELPPPQASAPSPVSFAPAPVADFKPVSPSLSSARRTPSVGRHAGGIAHPSVQSIFSQPSPPSSNHNSGSGILPQSQPTSITRTQSNNPASVHSQPATAARTQSGNVIHESSPYISAFEQGQPVGTLPLHHSSPSTPPLAQKSPLHTLFTSPQTPSIPISQSAGAVKPPVTNEQNCGYCNLPVKGSMLCIKDKLYHRHCFTCEHCKQPLVGKWASHDGKVYCVEHYDMLFSPRCAKCQQILNTKYINALDKSWHKDCFVCNKCGGQLGQYFDVIKELPYCSNCQP